MVVNSKLCYTKFRFLLLCLYGEMAKNNLFNWRKSQSLVGSQSKKSSTGVQAWIKRMQTESDNATFDAYGDAVPGINEIGAMQPDDQAIYEAQELVDRWMQNKHITDLNMELEFQDENWAASVKPMLNTSNENIDSEFYSLSEDGHIITHNPLKSLDMVSPSSNYDDLDIDYEEEASKMFQNFMSSSNVESKVMADLGMDKVTKKFKDPRPKMEQRHQMVKARNKERKEKMKSIQRERIMKKEAEMMARQKVQEEEKSRQMKKQMEEAEIQRQMTLIRKEMEEEKARAKEEEKRKKKAIKEAEEQIKLELRKKQILEKEEEERRKVAEEKMRKHIIVEMEEKTIRETAKNMQILNRHFAAWYGLVVEHRVKVGKARAMFDWRCKLRAWKAWRAFVNHIKSCKEAEEIAASLKMRYRKEQMAINHASLKMLRKCFVSWQLWVKEQQRLKEFKHEKEMNALRMAAFLDAAASGKLWNGSDAKLSPRVSQAGENSAADSAINDSVDNKIEEIFQSVGRNLQPPPQNATKKKQLSITLNRKELLKEAANRSKKLDVEKTAEMPNHTYGKAEPQCSCTKQTGENGNKESKKRSQKPLLTDGKEKILSKIDNEFIDARNDMKNSVTRLDLDCIDSTSEASGVLNDDLSSKREKNHLISRKSTVKSDRPMTKPVLLPMEERAKQRAEKKVLLEEKRKREEEYKLEQLKLEQEKLILAEMQMKKDRLRKKREEERLRKEAEIEKRRRQEEFQSLCIKADEHYHLTLTRKYGIQPWKRLIEIVKINDQIAFTYYSRTLFSKVLAEWQKFTDQSKSVKIHRANECYRTILLKRCLNAWKKFGKHYDILEDMARKHFSAVLMKKYFQYWQYFVTNERLAFWENEEKAEDHDERRILRSSFSQWTAFICSLKEERIRDKRKEELRKRVKEWLPDFLS